MAFLLGGGVILLRDHDDYTYHYLFCVINKTHLFLLILQQTALPSLVTNR